MSTRISWLAAIAFFTFLVCITVILIATRSRPLADPIQLKDGTRLVLRGATYGTNHIAPGNRLMRILPTAARSWIEARWPKAKSLFSDRSVSTPMLLLWVEVTAPAGQVSLSDHTTKVMLADENGLVAGDDEHVSLAPMTGTFGQVFSFAAVPARSSTLVVKWAEGTYEIPRFVAEWRLPNPGFSKSTPLQPEPLPSTRKSGDVAFTLRHVIFGVSDATYQPANHQGIEFRPADPAKELRTVLSGVLTFRGEASTAWSFAKISLNDASGNHLPSGTMSQSSFGTNLWVKWSPCLWPSEPWKVQIELKRKEQAIFAPSELLEFKNIELSHTGTTVLQEAGSLSGATIRLESLTVRAPITDQTSHSANDFSQLKVRIHRLSEGFHADFLRITDEKGRNYTASMWSASSQAGTLEREYSLPDLTNRLDRANILFAIHKSHLFTFTVLPQIASTNVMLLP